MTDRERAQKIWEAFCGELTQPATDDMKEALATAIKELRKLISGTNENVDWQDELNVMYVNGWDDAIHQIDAICEELEVL